MNNDDALDKLLECIKKLRVRRPKPHPGATYPYVDVSRAAAFDFESVWLFFRKMRHRLLLGNTERRLIVTFTVAA